MKKIEEIRKHGISTRGKTNLIRYLEGERLTQREAILAKCCDCAGYHSDGRVDCRMPDCPLYPYMPYRGKKSQGPFQRTMLNKTRVMSKVESYMTETHRTTHLKLKNSIPVIRNKDVSQQKIAKEKKYAKK
jgi:hypothetical protein